MKRTVGICITAFIFSLVIAMTSFAGTWNRHDPVYEDGDYEVTWSYTKDDGTLASNEWLEYNGNWYYFESGYMAWDEITPDGYYVNDDGVWDNSAPRNSVAGMVGTWIGTTWESEKETVLTIYSDGTCSMSLHGDTGTGKIRWITGTQFLLGGARVGHATGAGRFIDGKLYIGGADEDSYYEEFTKQ